MRSVLPSRGSSNGDRWAFPKIQYKCGSGARDAGYECWFAWGFAAEARTFFNWWVMRFEYIPIVLPNGGRPNEDVRAMPEREQKRGSGRMKLDSGGLRGIDDEAGKPLSQFLAGRG